MVTQFMVNRVPRAMSFWLKALCRFRTQCWFVMKYMAWHLPRLKFTRSVHVPTPKRVVGVHTLYKSIYIQGPIELKKENQLEAPQWIWNVNSRHKERWKSWTTGSNENNDGNVAISSKKYWNVIRFNSHYCCFFVLLKFIISVLLKPCASYIPNRAHARVHDHDLVKWYITHQ